MKAKYQRPSFSMIRVSSRLIGWLGCQTGGAAVLGPAGGMKLAAEGDVDFELRGLRDAAGQDGSLIESRSIQQHVHHLVQSY